MVVGCIEDSCDGTFDGIDADFNGDGEVNGADLGPMLAAWR